MRTARGWAVVVAGSTIALTGGWPVVAAAFPGAQADGVCSSYAATGAADGLRQHTSSPGFIVVEEAASSTVNAQATVDSFGTAVGYAAYPDPGETVLTATPQAGIPPETYPLFVRSQHPTTPSSSTETSVYRIAAESTAASAEATGESRAGGGGGDDQDVAGLSRSVASASCGDDGVISASGESLTEGISFAAGTVRVGRVRALATAEVGPDSETTIESDLQIEQFTIAGQAVTFGPDGLSVAGAPIVPAGNPLADVLAENQITLTYLEAEPQPDGQGVTSPGLQIGVTREVTGAAPTTVTFTYGRAFASASASAGAPPSVTAEPGQEITEPPPPTTASEGQATAPPSPPTAAAPTSGLEPRQVPADPVVATEPTADELSLISAQVIFSARSIYAVLVLGAAFLAMGGVILKNQGALQRWR